MQTLTLGPITIDRIVELERWPFAPAEMFPDITDEQVTAALRSLGEEHVDPRGRRIVLGIQTYLVRAPGLTVLLDTGNGNDKHRPALRAHHMFHTAYLDRLRARGVRPDDIDVVVSTHLHPDHCGWNTRLSGDTWVPTFPNARYLFARDEFAPLEASFESRPEDPLAADLARTFEDSVLPVVKAGQAAVVDTPHTILSAGDVRITMRSAPGHTRGHVVVEIEAGGRYAVAAGDVIHHPLQFADLDLAQGGDHDRARAAATRRELCEWCVDHDAVVLTAHFAGPGVGRIVRAGDGYRFAWPES
ncbi:MBL fold metallo-hydrolase [Actinoallomurus acaciae]|uniref:MBL fold metallo-hydrolase n=1 Tax=Actinoallomurus acaciae TaxID=502577 RepID=A0ABV5YDB5_9ACTN